MSNFYKDAKTVATGWATITSAGKSTVVSDSMKTANGTSKSDTIKVAPIDHATRRIYSNGGNDFIDISGNYGILWSKATVKSGKGNDSIRIYADVDGIHPATVNIDSGVGNDFVSIYGGNNGFHGGTIGLTTDEKTSVSLNLGDGNDKLFIHGLREKGIDISKVKIAGGKGNDLISICGGSSGIGGWADYGNATVSIDGGVGADTIAVNSIDNYGDVTITAGTGDVISVGSGTADYFFDSTKKVTINGAVFTAKSKNTSAKITTDSNSITLNSDWNGTIKLQQGQKLTDAVGNVISKAGTYSIVKGKSSVESGKAGIETIKGSNIYNYYGNRFVDCTDFNDSIINYQASNVTICAKNGNDYVNNYEGKDISINSGAGNDSVENSGTRATIESGSGNDSISNGSSKVTIIAGAGNDIIANGGASVTIDAGSGNDSISNRSSKVIINAGSGNDNIINDSSKVTIIAGTGNDSIENRNSEVYINGDEGSDHIDNWFHGDNLTINSGMGDDSIYNSCSYVTINAEDGNDYIKSSRGENVSINGGVGNDSIANSSTNVTIDAGNGNNYIYNDGNDVSMSSGNGDDSIENLDTDVVIDTGDGNDTVTNDSSKVTIHASSGNDYIKNLHKKNSSSTDVVINTGNGDDSIENNSAQVTIDAGNGNDYILCDFGKNTTINGGNGNDSIYMDCTTDYEINGGADSDYIYANGGGFCTINGGLGNDSICIDFGGTFAINGNSGNDVVTLSSEVTNVTINYASGEGKDTLYGFNSDDKIKITSGNISDAKLKGNDVVITVGKGSITLKNSKNKEITIIDSKGKEIKFTNTYKTEDTTKGGGSDENIDLFDGLNASTKKQIRKTALQNIKDFINLGEDTVKLTSKDKITDEDTRGDKDLFKQIMSDEKGIIRLMGKLFSEYTKYLRDENGQLVYQKDKSGNFILDSKGNKIKIKDTTTSVGIINAGFNAIINLGKILDSAEKIGSGKLKKGALAKQITSLSADITKLISNISELAGKGKFVTPMANYAMGLVTSIVGVADGVDKDDVKDIATNFSKLSAEVIKEYGNNVFLKNTKLGSWIRTSAKGKNLLGIANKANLIVSAMTGLYMGFEQYKESIDEYEIDGLPSKLVLADAWVDGVGTGIHSFANSFTFGLDDVAFNAIHMVASGLKYGFQWIRAQIKGEDTSKIKYSTTGGKSYMEFIGDTLKLYLNAQITGTKSDDMIPNVDNNKKIVSGAGHDHIYNTGSHVEIYAGNGNDTVFTDKTSNANNPNNYNAPRNLDKKMTKNKLG